MRLAVRALAIGLFLAPALSVAQEEPRTIGVWRITCETGLCQAFINLQVAEETILGMTLTLDRESDTASVLLRTPIGTALPPGIRIWPQADTSVDVPFQVCSESDCLAVLVLDAETRASLASLDQVRVAYFRYGESAPRVFDAPVGGFSEALEALSQ